MTIIDYSTPEGKLRMRLGDTSDLPFLPSSVYNAVYAERGNNLLQATIALGSMILGQLAFQTDRKMGLQLQVWSSQAFAAYKEFLILTVKDPAFMDMSPIPVNVQGTDLHPLIEFQKDWNLNYAQITQSQQMKWDAIGSPSSSAIWNWPQ